MSRRGKNRGVGAVKGVGNVKVRLLVGRIAQTPWGIESLSYGSVITVPAAEAKQMVDRKAAEFAPDYLQPALSSETIP